MAYYKDFVKRPDNPAGVFNDDGRGRLYAHRLAQIINILITVLNTRLTRIRAPMMNTISNGGANS